MTASPAHAMAPRQLGEGWGWLALWRDRNGDEREAGVHPTAEQATTVSKVMAGNENGRLQQRRRGPYKPWARAIEPRTVRRKGKKTLYQGRWIARDGRDLLTPGLHASRSRARHDAQEAADADNQRDPTTGDAQPLEYYEDHWPSDLMEDALRSHRDRLRAFGAVLPDWARRQSVAELSAVTINAAQAALVEKGYEPEYINQVIGTVRALLSRLVELRILNTNAAANVRMTQKQIGDARANRIAKAAAGETIEVRAGPGRRTYTRRRFPTDDRKPHAVSRRDFAVALLFLPAYWRPRIKLTVCGGLRPSESSRSQTATASISGGSSSS